MRLIGRAIALILLIAAALVILQDGSRWYYSGAFHPTMIGELWDRLLALLKVAGPEVQRRVPPVVWDNVVVYFLQFWAAPTFAVPGLILAWETRRRQRGGTRLD